jgi:hypothetical protein
LFSALAAAQIRAFTMLLLQAVGNEKVEVELASME